jgi:hypothetical protein
MASAWGSRLPLPTVAADLSSADARPPPLRCMHTGDAGGTFAKGVSMRSRTIKPGFFTSEQLASCSPLARILFAGLWCAADREGKLRDRPRKIKAELLPYEAEADADGWLAELAEAGLILRYQVIGERFIKVLEFGRHQNPHPKEQASEIPEPCNSAAGSDLSAASREKVMTSRAGSSGSSVSSDSDPGSSFSHEKDRNTDLLRTCVLKLSATRDEAAGAAREGTDPDSSPELSDDEPSPSEAKALAGGPPTKAATTTDDLGPPPCPGPPEILAHEKLPLSSVGSGQLDLAAVPPAEAEGEERRSPATSPPPEPIDRLIEIWDRVCVPAGFARAHRTDAQRKKARTRMREAGWFAAFEAACLYVAMEPFYRGGGDRGWVMTFGWLLEPGRAEKTAEQAQTTRARPPPPPAKKLCTEPAESFEGAVGIEEMQIT